MKKATKKFYYIPNTCDYNINIAGEILVVLDDKKKVIWHHDYSDDCFDFPDFLPREFMKKFKATYDSDFIELDGEDIVSIKNDVEKYLNSNGYESIED